MDVFHSASLPLRARMLSMSKPGAMSALSAVPSSHHGQLLPLTFITAMQLSLRLPLSLLQGLQRCSCGKPLDAYGDHLLSCMQFIEKKKPGHDLVEGVVASLARSAGHNVSHDSHRPHRGHRAYSPNWCPDLTCLFGTKVHTHILVDITCPSVVSSAAVPVASRDPDALSFAHEADKRRTYMVLLLPMLSCPLFLTIQVAWVRRLGSLYSSAETRLRGRWRRATLRSLIGRVKRSPHTTYSLCRWQACVGGVASSLPCRLFSVGLRTGEGAARAAGRAAKSR